MRWSFGILLVQVLGLGIAGQVLADTCYERSYSAAHLKKNPNQTVREIAIRFTAAHGERYAGVRVVFRGDDRPYTNGLICWTPEPADHGDAFIGCSVECDGGAFVARRRGDDAILVETAGFLVSGDCDADEGALRRVEDEGAAKTVYKLYATPLADCPVAQ